MTKRIGGSIAVVLPRQTVELENIKENQEITLEVKKGIKGEEIFGLFPEWKIDTQKAKDEMRKEW